MKLSEKFKQSVKDLSSLRNIVLCGLFIALRTIIGFLAIPIGDYNRIDFSYLAIAMCGMLLGPISAGIVGGLGDIVTLIVRPTGMFNPIITLSRITAGLIYGCFLYKSVPKLKNIIIMCVINLIITDLGLTTLGLCTIGGSVFSFIFPIRVTTYGLLLPVNITMIYIVAKILNTPAIRTIMKLK